MKWNEIERIHSRSQSQWNSPLFVRWHRPAVCFSSLKCYFIIRGFQWGSERKALYLISSILNRDHILTTCAWRLVLVLSSYIHLGLPSSRLPRELCQRIHMSSALRSTNCTHSKLSYIINWDCGRCDLFTRSFRLSWWWLWSLPSSGAWRRVVW